MVQVISSTQPTIFLINSLLITHYSLLITHYFLLITHYSLLITHFSSPNKLKTGGANNTSPADEAISLTSTSVFKFKP